MCVYCEIIYINGLPSNTALLGLSVKKVLGESGVVVVSHKEYVVVEFW
jgi:hypothetical protein